MVFSNDNGFDIILNIMVYIIKFRRESICLGCISNINKGINYKNHQESLAKFSIFVS